MSTALILNVSGMILSLVGFLVLVREVRYAHLTEFHSLRMEDALRKIDELAGMSGKTLRDSTETAWGKALVYAFGPIPDAEWDKSAEELKAKYAVLREQLSMAQQWKRKVPAAALSLRMRWLTVGATLVVLGVLLQVTSTIWQAMPGS
jgi:hypothetical protein